MEGASGDASASGNGDANVKLEMWRGSSKDLPMRYDLLYWETAPEKRERQRESAREERAPENRERRRRERGGEWTRTEWKRREAGRGVRRG